MIHRWARFRISMAWFIDRVAFGVSLNLHSIIEKSERQSEFSMKSILLDTNAYTRLLTGDESVLNVLSTAETVYMSIFVLGELYAGFADGSQLTFYLAISNTVL